MPQKSTRKGTGPAKKAARHRSPVTGKPSQRTWTEKDRREVTRLTNLGLSTREVAAVLGTSAKTLRRHFGDLLQPARSGPKATDWTQAQRDYVAAMAGFGMPAERIAIVLKATKHEIETHFAEELDMGSPMLDAQVITSLFEMATQDKVPAAAIFWAKARLGWQDRIHIGGKVKHDHEHEVRAGTREAVNQLDDDGREQLGQVLGKLGAKSLIDASPPGEDELLN